MHSYVCVYLCLLACSDTRVVEFIGVLEPSVQSEIESVAAESGDAGGSVGGKGVTVETGDDKENKQVRFVSPPKKSPPKSKPAGCTKSPSPKKARFDELKNANCVMARKIKNKEDKITELLIDKAKADEKFDKYVTSTNKKLLDKDTTILARETRIANLGYQIERLQEKKEVVYAKIKAERVAIEGKATAERDVAKAQAKEIKYELNRVVSEKEALAKTLNDRLNEWHEVQAANTRLVEERNYYQKDNRKLNDKVSDLKKDNDALVKQVVALKDERLDKRIRNQELLLQKKNLDLQIEAEKAAKGVRAEEAKQQRQLAVDQHRFDLRDKQFSKRKRDKEDELIKKQEENNRKLKSHMHGMMSNCDPTGFASLHYNMNRNNPGHGQFMNSSQLQQSVASYTTDYESNMSRIAGVPLYTNAHGPPSVVDVDGSVASGRSRQQRQQTLTQMAREDKLAPPLRSKMDPLPAPFELPDGIFAFHDELTGKVLYKAYHRGDVLIEQSIAELQLKRQARSEVVNHTLTQMSDLTQTQAQTGEDGEDDSSSLGTQDELTRQEQV